MSAAPAQTSPLAPAPGPARAVAPLLALLTLAAAALRLPFLATQSFWFDETYTAHVVAARTLGGVWDGTGASESTPPLFYVLAWAWSRLAGDRGEATLRTISALALIAAVPVTYGALRRLIGVRAALGAAAIVAASPLLVSYALDARAYGLLVLAGLLSVWTCGALLDEPASAPRWALWALAAAAAIWTHWFAGFLALGEAIALLWLRPRAWRGLLVACGAVAVALVPLIGLLRQQTGDDRAAFISQDGLAGRIAQLARQFAAGPNVPRTWLEAVALALAAGGVLAGTALVGRQAAGGGRERRAGQLREATERDAEASGAPGSAARDSARALLTIALVALLVPLALAASGLYDRFNVRNVLFLLPLAAGLAALALTRLRAIPLAAYLALCALIAVWVSSSWRYGNADWRGALRRTEALAPGRPVVAVTPLGEPVVTLYLHRAPSGVPLATRRAWLVIEPARTAGHRALGAVDPPLAAALLAAFPEHRERRLHGFRLIGLTAPAPVTLNPGALPGATLFAAAAGRAGVRR